MPDNFVPPSRDPSFKEKMVGVTALILLVVVFVPIVLDRPVHKPEPLSPLPEKLPGIPPLPEAQAEPPAVAIPQTQATVAESWVLQAGAFSNKDFADNMVLKLRQNNYRAFIRQVQLEDASRYMVLIGPELKIDSLREVQQKLQQDMKIKGILKKYP